MGKSQKRLNQLLRKLLKKHSSPGDNHSLHVSYSVRSRWVSFSSASLGSSSRVSSQQSSTWGSAANSLSRKLSDLDCDCDCEDECCWDSSDPRQDDVPAGCLPVYVGEERKRFIIPTSYLPTCTFQELLAKSEEEYGLRCDGGLRIATSPEAFEHVLHSLQGQYKTRY